MTPRVHHASAERRLGVALLLAAIPALPIWAISFPYFAMGGVIGLIAFIVPPIGLAGTTVMLLWRTRHDDARPTEIRNDHAMLWNMTPDEVAKTAAVQNEKN